MQESQEFHIILSYITSGILMKVLITNVIFESLNILRMQASKSHSFSYQSE